MDKERAGIIPGSSCLVSGKVFFNCIRTLLFYKLQLHPVNAPENIQNIKNILFISSFIFSQKVVKWY